MNIYKVGKIVKGTVTGIENYGAFVSLENDYTGLIHISEISYGLSFAVPFLRLTGSICGTFRCLRWRVPGISVQAVSPA